MSARRIAGKAAVWGIAGIAAAGMALAASGIASADVTEEAPSPQVSSRQASVSSYQGTRNNAPNVARGQADTRLAGAGIVQAQGTVRDTPADRKQRIADLGRQLYDRIAGFADNLDKVGRSLDETLPFARRTHDRFQHKGKSQLLRCVAQFGF